jgi:hypothetical protein
MDGTNTWYVNVSYLGEAPLEPVVQSDVIRTIRSRLKEDSAEVRLERIAPEIGIIEFVRGSSSIPILGMIQLDHAGRVMRENMSLTLSVSGLGTQDENSIITDNIDHARLKAIADYLESRWQIGSDRITYTDAEPEGRTRIAFAIKQENTDTATPAPVTSALE